MAELSFSPVATSAQTATDRIFETLYDAVVSLKLPPGTKVSETEIARQLDVSRQPVRDAFFRLSKLGFISIRPQRATLVSKISERAVLDATFIRIAIEVECLRACVEKADAAGLADLRRNLDQQANAINDPDPGAFHRCDEAFHALICQLAQQSNAWDLILEQKAHMDRVRWLTLSVDRRTLVLNEHTAIVNAVEAGDAARADDLLRSHIGDIRHALRTIRDGNADYFESDR